MGKSCTATEPKSSQNSGGVITDVCMCVSKMPVHTFERMNVRVQERLPWLRWKEQMGGGSGLLCLRTTVALRIRVPPTFHSGPQLPTTAHGARPAPAHHGPAPHAICLLGQTTLLPFPPPPPSRRCVLASLLLHHPPSENKKTATWVLHVAFQSSEKTEGFRGHDSIRGSAN